MQTTTKIILAVCSIVTVETLAPANAQYYPPPGYGYATVIGHGMDVPRGGRFRAETGTLQRSGRWWLEHLEWMPARLHGTGWKLRTLSIWKVRQAAKLLTKR